MSIATQITALTDDRTAIRSALVTKGVAAASGHGFDDFAADIAAIPAGTDISDTTAIASDVRAGKYFHLANGSKVQGSVAEKAAQTYYISTVAQSVSANRILTGTQTFAVPEIYPIYGHGKKIHGIGNYSLTSGSSTGSASEDTESLTLRAISGKEAVGAFSGSIKRGSYTTLICLVDKTGGNDFSVGLGLSPSDTNYSASVSITKTGLQALKVDISGLSASTDYYVKVSTWVYNSAQNIRAIYLV